MIALASGEFGGHRTYLYRRFGPGFSRAILAAANLGDDADTTAAVCGQIAGAFYGESGIPSRWLDRLVMVGEIRQLADQLVEAARIADNGESFAG